ncbi:MAG: DUF6174 domain-containing protein [Gemmatimonadaceae bacterium]
MRHTLAFLSALVLLTAACDGESVFGTAPERVALSAARERWADAKPFEYQFNYTRICFCPTLTNVRVTVRDDVVISARVISTGEELPPAERAQIPTIDGLFDIIDAAIDQDAHDLRVEYDRSMGFPQSIILDYKEMIADDEIFYEVTEVMSTATVGG